MRIGVGGKKDFGEGIDYCLVLSFNSAIGLGKVGGGEGLLDAKGVKSLLKVACKFTAIVGPDKERAAITRNYFGEEDTACGRRGSVWHREGFNPFGEVANTR